MAKRYLLSTISALVWTACVTAPASAQVAAPPPPTAEPDEAVTLDEVVVNGQFRAQRLQDAPMPINAFSGEFLQALRVDSLSDLATLVPGVEIFEQTVQNPNFVVRGVNSGGSAANNENRISVFQDGVSINRAQGALTELFDIGQIEVLKGPQGTLYGRGSTAGAIAVTSARPDFSGPYGEVSGGLETDNGRRAQLILNAPLSDTVALRGAFLHHAREGFITNVINDETTGGKDTTAGRVSLTLRPNDRLEGTLIFNGQRDRSNSNVFASVTIPVPGGVFASTGDNRPWTPLVNRTDPFGDMASDLGDRSYIRRDIAGVTALVDLDLDAFTLSSLSSYRYLKSDDYFDVDGSYLFIINGLEDTTINQYTTDLRLAYDDGGRLTGVIGAGVFREETDYVIALDYDPRRVVSIVTPNTPSFQRPVDVNGRPTPVLPLPFPAMALETGLTTNITTSYSIYADGAWRLTDRATVSAGVRYTVDDKRLETTRPLTNLGIFIPTSTAATQEREADFDAFQPRLTLDYRWSDDVMTYVGVTTGYRSGVLPEAGRTNTAPLVDPEYVVSYEVGARTTSLDGRLRLNGSIYYYDWTDFQTTVIDPNTRLAVPAAAGAASALGAELEGDLRLSDTFTIFGNLNVMDGKFDEFVSGASNFSGKRMPYSPRFRATVGLNKRFALNSGWSLDVDGQATYRSLQYFSNENTTLESQDAFWLVNGSLSLVAPDEETELRLYGQNLLDEAYLGDAGNTGRSFGTPTWVPGHPRVVGFEVVRSF
jgi:outer membrane receptor protein involved in Fe transport